MSFLPLALISTAIRKGHDALSIRESVFPLAVVLTPIRPFENSFPVKASPLKLTIVSALVGVDINSVTIMWIVHPLKLNFSLLGEIFYQFLQYVSPI